jgi:hypothetical protein
MNFHTLVLLLNDLEAACLSLSRVVSGAYSSKFEHFICFLQALETYGTGYSDDIDIRRYKVREQESHSESAIKLLKQIIKGFELVLITQRSFEFEQIRASLCEENQTLASHTLNEQLKSLFIFQRDCFKDLLRI